MFCFYIKQAAPQHSPSKLGSAFGLFCFYVAGEGKILTGIFEKMKKSDGKVVFGPIFRVFCNLLEMRAVGFWEWLKGVLRKAKDRSFASES